MGFGSLLPWAHCFIISLSFFIPYHSFSIRHSICVILRRLMCVKWENKVVFVLRTNLEFCWGCVTSFFYVLPWFLGCKRKYLVSIWCRRMQHCYCVSVWTVNMWISLLWAKENILKYSCHIYIIFLSHR